MWHIIPSPFQPTPWVKNHRLKVCKTSCNSSTHFAYFNCWQKVDGETSIVKFGHHSRAYFEGLTKFWCFRGSSASLYSPFCTLKSHTFGPILLDNPEHPAEYKGLHTCLEGELQPVLLQHWGIQSHHGHNWLWNTRRLTEVAYGQCWVSCLALGNRLKSERKAYSTTSSNLRG